MTEDVKSGAKPIVLGGVVAAVAAVVILALWPATEEEAVVAEPVVAVEPAPEPEPEVVVEATPAPITPEVEETAPADVLVEAPTVPDVPTGPQFDTFRVDPNGAIVIAGRAEPGQVVDVILGGEAIDRVTADNGGMFVALPMAGPSDQARRLSLLADPDGAAIPSEKSFLVAPIAPPVVVAAVPEVVEEPAPAEPVEEAEAVVETAPAPEPVVVAEAPTVLEADADGVRVVQDSAADNVALDAITYDPEGEVQLSGRAIGDGAVQVYIDNEPLTTSEVTQGGDWQIELPQIDTGVYTLRIDEVDEEGTVVSRLETPFKREEPEEVAAVLAEETAQDGFEVAVKTVQPGATLWAIAEENLGSGIFYIEVFEANSDLIRDPDLIYPGQIFRMPEMSE